VREGREEIMPTLAGGIGPLEIGIIAAVLVLLFGVGKLAGVGGAIGRSVREFRRELREEQGEAPAEPREKVEAKAGEGKV
jgi:sec-independent protein translocase protein TatA